MASTEITHVAKSAVQKEAKPDKKLIHWILPGVLFLFFAVAIGGTLLIVDRVTNLSGLPLEIIKALLQLGVVAGAGTVVSLLVYEYQRNRQNFDKRAEEERKDYRESLKKQEEDKSYRADFIKQTMSRIVETYNSVKRCRRLLRAEALVGAIPPNRVFKNSGVKIRLSVCDKFIEDLNEDQLEIESLVRQLDVAPALLPGSETIRAQLKRMEKYLGNIISEYEAKRPNCNGEEERVEDFPVLLEFLYHKERDPAPELEAAMAFELDFSHPLEAVQKQMREALEPKELAKATA